MKINIVLVNPTDLGHESIYDEVVTFFYYSIKELGHNVTKSINTFEKDSLNLVVANQYLSFIPQLAQFKYIIIQLERLSFEGGWFGFEHLKPKFFTDFLPLLQNAEQIWDYSKENINFLKDYNLKPYLIPFGFCDKLQTFTPVENKDIDVIFYGVPTPRRDKLTNELKKYCNFHYFYGLYGLERDKLIARSKILISIHAQDPPKTLEQVRLFYPMHNNCFVISEDTSWNPYSSYLITYPYDKLIDGILEWLKKDNERDIHAKNSLQGLKNIYSKELIQKALMDINT